MDAPRRRRHSARPMNHAPYPLLASSFTLHAIGRARTPWRGLADCPRGVRGVPDTAWLEIDPVYEEALLGIEQASHLHVLYWLHEAARAPLRRPTPHDGVLRGVLATRSPVRPNPIGMAVVRQIRREGARVLVSALDCLDGTPLIDIKPYLPLADCVPDATLAWQAAPAAPTPEPLPAHGDLPTAHAAGRGA